MLTIDCTVDHAAWGDESPLHDLSTESIQAVLAFCDETIPNEAEVSLLFTDNATIQKLNRDWRDMDKPTNVLSFAANEGGGPVTPLLGDIVLAHETIAQEAIAQNKAFADHLRHLVIHGFLHLIGYDHIEEDDALRMETAEIQALDSMGIADPFAAP